MLEDMLLLKLNVLIAACWITIVSMVAKHFIRILKILQNFSIVFYIEPGIFFELIRLPHALFFRKVTLDDMGLKTRIWRYPNVRGEVYNQYK